MLFIPTSARLSPTKRTLPVRSNQDDANWQGHRGVGLENAITEPRVRRQGFQSPLSSPSLLVFEAAMQMSIGGAHQ